MLNAQQLFTALQLIKSAGFGSPDVGSSLAGGLFRGGMGIDNVRKGLLQQQRGNMSMQRLQAMGKFSKLFKPRHPYNAVQAGDLNQLARTKALFPGLAPRWEQQARSAPHLDCYLLRPRIRAPLERHSADECEPAMPRMLGRSTALILSQPPAASLAMPPTAHCKH